MLIIMRDIKIFMFVALIATVESFKYGQAWVNFTDKILSSDSRFIKIADIY